MPPNIATRKQDIEEMVAWILAMDTTEVEDRVSPQTAVRPTGDSNEDEADSLSRRLSLLWVRSDMPGRSMVANEKPREDGRMLEFMQDVFRRFGGNFELLTDQAGVEGSACFGAWSRGRGSRCRRDRSAFTCVAGICASSEATAGHRVSLYRRARRGDPDRFCAIASHFPMIRRSRVLSTPSA